MIRAELREDRSGRVVWALLGALALVLFLAPQAGAQRTVTTVVNDLRFGGADVWAVWTSPFRAGPRDWLSAAAVVGTGAIVSEYDDDVDRWIVAHPSSTLEHAIDALREDAPHGRWGDLFTQKHILTYMAPIYAVGFVLDKPGIRDAAMGCLAAAYASGGARSLLYKGVARDRPSERAVNDQGDQYRFDWPGGPWERQSFFGGHVANTVACTSFWGARYHLGVVEPLLYTYAAGVAVARQYDRRHWTSDNLVGAAFGLAIGRAVAHRSTDRLERRRAANRGQAMLDPHLQPIVSNDGQTAYLGWELHFR